MTTSLRNFTSDNVEVSLDNISSIRFGDYLNSIPLPAILSVFRAEELDNFGLLTVDSNLIYSIVDVLLGGRRGTAAMRIEGRPYTTIERVLVEPMVEAVLDEQQVDLRKVLALNGGDPLRLNATPDSLVELRAGTIPLTRGRMGRRNHHIAVRGEAPLTPSAKSALQRIK